MTRYRATAEGNIPFTPEEEAAEDARLAAIAAEAPALAATAAREAAKQARAEAVEAITVTTAAGHIFDGNELSIFRMKHASDTLNTLSAALAAGTPIALPVGADTASRVVAGKYEMQWVLADNSIIFVGADELLEASILASAKMAMVWPL